jgi:hypothetical protein
VAWPLWDLAGDLAVARGGGPVETDATRRIDARYLRRRIVAALWIPFAFGAIALGSGLHSWVAGALAFAAVIALLWLVAERGDRLWALIWRRGTG